MLVIFCVLISVPLVYNDPIEPLRSIDIHCVESDQDHCFVQEALDIHDATTWNFINSEILKNESVFGVKPPFGGTAVVTVMPFGIFEYFQNLRVVTFECVHMETIQKENFKGANALDYLSFENNLLHTIPSNVFEYAENITMISFSYNRITKIEDFAFNNMRFLHYLNLANNLLTVLGENVFAGAENIKTLYLHNNRIESIENSLTKLSELDFLKLDRNRLQTLSDSLFLANPKLSYLNLSANRLKHIGTSIYQLNAIERVDLDGNPMEDFDFSLFARLPNLKSISISNTSFQLTQFDSVQNSPKSLHHIDLSNNSLSDSNILIRLSKFKSLIKLNLRYNNFSNLEFTEDFLSEKFPYLYEIVLCNNRFKCKTLKRLLDSLDRSRVNSNHCDNGAYNHKHYKRIDCLDDENNI